jgi:ubiquitin carboxyl-terminal hydrolase 5/13
VVSGADSTAGASSGGAAVDASDGEGKYTLMAVISHLGKNTDHGHYVCHVKKDGQWVLFNDEKVR